MRYLLLVLVVIGIAASSLALHEHYRPYGESACDINDHWDCGIVNHSPYAVIEGVPVAVIGIVGYVLLGFLAWMRFNRLMLALSVPALAFSLYLAHIERDLLGVWCLYCVISLGTIFLVTIILLASVMIEAIQKSRGPGLPDA